MVRRFHAAARFKGVELLLQEKIPRTAPIDKLPRVEISTARVDKLVSAFTPWYPPVFDSLPQVHLLSNGNYGLLLTSNGSGYSFTRDVALTRWRADPTGERWGTWIYIQDRDTNQLWSLGYQPTAVRAQAQGVSYEVHRAEYWRVEAELHHGSLEEIMRIQEQIISHICRSLTEDFQEELMAAGRDWEKLEKVQAPFPRLSYDETIKMFNSKRN